MKFICSLVVLGCALLEATGYPYYPAYGNVDSLSYGSGDSSRGGMVMSRYYNPYYTQRAAGGGMAAFVYRQPQEQPSGQYYQPDRRRQTVDTYVPPQQNEVYYPQQPETPFVQPETPFVQPETPVAITEPTELADPTEKPEVVSTTLKTVAVVPEISEPEVPEVEEVAEPAPKPKKALKKKPVKQPVEEDDEDEAPKMPAGTFFPMFFGYGGRSGAPSGPMAVANAYSTGRGGVATSHATAYGAPRPDERYYKSN